MSAWRTQRTITIVTHDEPWLASELRVRWARRFRLNEFMRYLSRPLWRVAGMALLAAACTGTGRSSMQAPAPAPDRIRIDGPGSFGPRVGDRVAVIVDGLRVGQATCDSSRQLVLEEEADRALRHDVNVVSAELVLGVSAAREYELRGEEVGALVITTRRPPDDSLQVDQREDHGSNRD